MSRAFPPDRVEYTKAEVRRLLHPDWMHFQSKLWLDNGYSPKDIGLVLKRHEDTIKAYARYAAAELEFEGSLWFLLSTRTRNLLLKHGIDAAVSDAPDRVSALICSYKDKPIPGLGPVTLKEILNAVDEIHETSSPCECPA